MLHKFLSKGRLLLEEILAERLIFLLISGRDGGYGFLAFLLCRSTSFFNGCLDEFLG